MYAPAPHIVMHNYQPCLIIAVCSPPCRAVYRRTDRAVTYRRAGRGAVGITDVRAPRWAATTCVAANRPDRPIRRRRVLPANRRRPEGLWRPRLLIARQSSEDNPPPKRYWSPEASEDKWVRYSRTTVLQCFKIPIPIRLLPASQHRSKI